MRRRDDARRMASHHGIDRSYGMVLQKGWGGAVGVASRMRGDFDFY